MLVKEKIGQWANYKDRSDSFDDSKEIKKLISMITKDKQFNQYVKSFLPDLELSLVSKPFGEYGVDIGFIDSNTKDIVGTMDLERWSQWDDDWPNFYKHIHFLSRKEKFLKNDKPFFMAYFNFKLSKVLLVSRESIEKFTPIKKHFKVKNVNDNVREISLSEGHIFGEGITEKERKIFNAGRVTSECPSEVVGSTPTPRSTFPL